MLCPCDGAVTGARLKLHHDADIAALAMTTSYAAKADRIAIYSPLGDVVAIIELVSPGNKNSRHAIRAFVEKTLDFLFQGIHVLIIDLFPPNPRNPQGIHKAIWDELREEPFEPPSDKPLTLVAYSAGVPKKAYVEPVAVVRRLHAPRPFDVADERHAAGDNELVIIGLCIMLGQPLAPPLLLGIPAGDEHSLFAWSASRASLHSNWAVAALPPFSVLSTLTNLHDLPQPASPRT